MRPGFVPSSGKRIHRDSLGGQGDPVGAEKDALESAMAAALMAYFDALRQRIQDELEPQIPDSRKAIKAIRIPAEFWREEAKRLLAVILLFVNEGANGGAQQAQRIAEGVGIGIDWTMAFTEAADWAREHATELVTQVTGTTKERIRSLVANWIEAPDMTLPDLWRQLQKDHAFSRYRAELIAQTETTNAYAEGEMDGARAMEESGLLQYEKEWQTVAVFGTGPGTVCPICEPLHGVTVDGADGYFDTAVGPLKGPAAHPGCRCWINVIPRVP